MSIDRKCDKCGNVTKRRKRKGVLLCDDCAIDNYLANVQQQRAKSGPYYEKWLKNWKTATGLILKEEKQTNAV